MIYKLKRIKNIINMDGIEWKRKKWGKLARMWFYLNERAACALGDTLIADHPEIERHLKLRARNRNIETIPYGADRIADADVCLLDCLELSKYRYALVVARGEPENHILEIVTAFSAQRRDYKLAVLGKYDPDINQYHRRVLMSASDDVVFPGPIYDFERISAIRKFALFYIHGHSAGGTNPSLVEAMGACLPVIAHDNPFNRWVAGSGALYFRDTNECAKRISELGADAALRALLARNAERRYAEQFTWDRILLAYERLLLRHIGE
jgi:glycosyltransferase involved in cell wall biosynthesis